MTNLYTKKGLLLARDYTRIVRGKGIDYYEVHFNNIIYGHLRIPKREEWRAWSDDAYYMEFRSKDSERVMVYHQKRPVRYADYKVNYYYIEVDDVVARD